MSLATATLPTIKYEGKDFAGLVSANHFGNLFAERPLKLGGWMDTLYKVNLQDDIINFVNKYPTLELDDDLPYEWEIMGADSKNIPLVKATDLSGNAVSAASTFGKYGERFYMYFGELLFFQTHVIVGTHPDTYQLRVATEPEQVEGGNWRIQVELITSDPELYVPYSEIAVGTSWSVDYSVSEQFLSKKGSDISYSSPFLMSNRISMIRKETTIPGEMIRKGENSPVSFNWQVVNDNGQAVKKKTWLNRLDFEFDRQFRRERARMLFFGKGNQQDKQGNGAYGNYGDSGGPIKLGMGLREQISASNTTYYTTFNIETFVNFALSLSVGRIPQGDRRFVIGTGEHGLKMISRAIETYAGANALAYDTDNNRMNTIKGGGAENKWSYQRPQFVKFADINGLRFEFMHIPWYDDKVRNKLMHPDGGTVESYRLTIMDFGVQDSKPNIQLVRLKGQPEEFGYIPGLRDPFSPGGRGSTRGGKMMATAVDGYEIHRADWVGMKVHNPMRLGEWIPNLSL